MAYTHPILAEIEAYLVEHDISPSYFGKKAVGNSELVARLRNGGDLTSRTAQKLRDFMEAEGEA